MPFKINISEKNGKSWKLALESESLVGKHLGDMLHGKDLSADLEGYEFKIAGASDTAGFAHKADLEGPQLRRVLLSKGWGMHNNSEGVRKKKSVRGKQLGERTSQINLVIVKPGHKALSEIFPDQNKAKEAAAPAA